MNGKDCLAHDSERRQTSWQNAPGSSPTTKAAYAYDGAGQRVAQSVTTNGTTSTTYYVGGGLEELTVSGSTSTLTKYESVPGVCEVVIVGSGPSESISYVVSDGLGSVSEALDGSGHTLAKALYGPYGGVRYSSGTMPTAKGYTGQYADASSSGLDYYNARYYDPLVGQFTSADSDGAGGLNRYAYVADDPETRTDPSGHVYTCVPDCSGGGSNGGNGTCTSNCGGGCTSDATCGCYTSCGGTPPSGPTGGCHSNCHGGNPCVGCSHAAGASGQPTPQQVQQLVADAYGAVSQYQHLIDLLNKFLGFAQWISDRIPFSVAVLAGLEAGLNTAISELQILQDLYVAQANWEPSQWTAVHIFEYSGTIGVVTAVLAVMMAAVAVDAEELPAALEAATAEDCPPCAAVIAYIGPSVTNVELEPYLVTLAGVSGAASLIAVNTTSEEMGDV